MDIWGLVTSTLTYFLITVAGIFVIVNPITSAFVFMSLLPNATEKRRREIARRSTKIATAVFFVFALLGSVIFQLFGITLAAFRIAGGIILFGIAMDMIRKKEGGPEDTEDPEQPEGEKTDDISVIPLAIPFMSGPGSIATVMILTSEAPSIYHTVLVFLAVVMTTIACYFAMVYSKVIVRHIGDTGKQIVTKVFGLILSVISVQFVINGTAEVLARYGIKIVGAE